MLHFQEHPEFCKAYVMSRYCSSKFNANIQAPKQLKQIAEAKNNLKPSRFSWNSWKKSINKVQCKYSAVLKGKLTGT